ncbi:hypothetical protein F511_37988 [Dorcoceras hygrometricum]|uniref:Uncharacterized protein n=1 Tax=Dorcoceras hygrometricum TaxID=472368 RepID=A0A2Z7B5Y6_9LAMI|nr:hypothetical protein F511_37988 [Dorcoceras hygrometricum]
MAEQQVLCQTLAHDRQLRITRKLKSETEPNSSGNHKRRLTQFLSYFLIRPFSATIPLGKRRVWEGVSNGTTLDPKTGRPISRKSRNKGMDPSWYQLRHPTACFFPASKQQLMPATQPGQSNSACAHDPAWVFSTALAPDRTADLSSDHAPICSPVLIEQLGAHLLLQLSIINFDAVIFFKIHYLLLFFFPHGLKQQATFSSTSRSLSTPMCLITFNLLLNFKLQKHGHIPLLFLLSVQKSHWTITIVQSSLWIKSDPLGPSHVAQIPVKTVDSSQLLPVVRALCASFMRKLQRISSFQICMIRSDWQLIGWSTVLVANRDSKVIFKLFHPQKPPRRDTSEHLSIYGYAHPKDSGQEYSSISEINQPHCQLRLAQATSNQNSNLFLSSKHPACLKLKAPLQVYHHVTLPSRIALLSSQEPKVN